MKRLFTIILLTIICYQVKAQDLYHILAEGHKRINLYDYQYGQDVKESIDKTFKLTKLYKRNLKIISDALLASDFRNNNVNDTLLLITSYDDEVVGGPPSYIFAKSSISMRVLHIESYRDSKYVDIYPAEKYALKYYPIMYSGDVNSFKKLFIDKGGNFGGYIALRIVIKNSKIVFPVLLWTYTGIFDELVD